MAKDKKEGKPNSGRSFSSEFPQGRRRKVGGNELAPKSLRRRGKQFLAECSDRELVKAGVKE